MSISTISQSHLPSLHGSMQFSSCQYNWWKIFRNPYFRDIMIFYTQWHPQLLQQKEEPPWPLLLQYLLQKDLYDLETATNCIQKVSNPIWTASAKWGLYKHTSLSYVTDTLFVGTEGTISKIYHLDILKSCSWYVFSSEVLRVSWLYWKISTCSDQKTLGTVGTAMTNKHVMKRWEK